jgi:hypothetical protein
MAHANEASTAAAAPDAKIPQLRNVTPSIFVPFRDDFTKPGEEPRDRIERLKRILTSIDVQRVGVRENLMFLFEREKRRLVKEAQAHELAAGIPNTKPGLASEDVDWTIQNMETPPIPDTDYNIKDMPAPEKFRIPPPGASIRERTTTELLNLVEGGLIQLGGYEEYMAGIKKHYLDCLDKELARFQEVGMRPEERASRVAEAPM